MIHASTAAPIEAGETRERILREAEKLFASKGYEGVSIRDIARACGVSNAALYYHFESKEAILLATLREALGTLRKGIEQAAKEGADLREKLLRISRAYLDILQRKGSIIRLALLETGGLGKEIAELIDEYHKQIPGHVAGVVEQGMHQGGFRDVDPYTVAVMLLWTLNAFIVRQIVSGEAIVEQEIIPPVLDLLFLGFAIG